MDATFQISRHFFSRKYPIEVVQPRYFQVALLLYKKYRILQDCLTVKKFVMMINILIRAWLG
jgi:hypothetical protein